jgi:hypothetical protein
VPTEIGKPMNSQCFLTSSLICFYSRNPVWSSFMCRIRRVPRLIRSAVLSGATLAGLHATVRAPLLLFCLLLTCSAMGITFGCNGIGFHGARRCSAAGCGVVARCVDCALTAGFSLSPRCFHAALATARSVWCAMTSSCEPAWGPCRPCTAVPCCHFRASAAG